MSRCVMEMKQLAIDKPSGIFLKNLPSVAVCLCYIVEACHGPSASKLDVRPPSTSPQEHDASIYYPIPAIPSCRSRNLIIQNWEARKYLITEKGPIYIVGGALTHTHARTHVCADGQYYFFIRTEAYMGPHTILHRGRSFDPATPCRSTSHHHRVCDIGKGRKGDGRSNGRLSVYAGRMGVDARGEC